MNILSTNKHIGAGILAAFIALTPMPLLAGDHGDNDGNYREASQAIHSLEQNQITFPQLLQTAEEAGKGIAIGIEAEDDDTLQVFEVTLLRDNEILRVSLSPLTGEVIKVGSPEIIHSAVARLTKRYDSLKNAKTSLQEAVTIAEEAEKGIAYHAHIEDMDDWTGYEINVISNGNPVRLIIDPETGRVVGRKVLTRHQDEH